MFLSELYVDDMLEPGSISAANFRQYRADRTYFWLCGSAVGKALSAGESIQAVKIFALLSKRDSLSRLVGPPLIPPINK